VVRACGACPKRADPDAAWRIAQQHARIDDAQTLTPFTHVFSHYRLRSSRCCSTARQRSTAIADNPHLRWCSVDELSALGLPAPVRHLLLQVGEID
jgi:A/G-specific adenine glycosylase